MKAKFVLLVLILGAIVAPIVGHVFYPSLMVASYLKGFVALLLIIGSFMLLTSRNKKPARQKIEDPVEPKAEAAFVPSFVPRQDAKPIPTVTEPIKSEPVPAVAEQATIPFLKNPTVQELREIAERMDVFFIPFLWTLIPENSGERTESGTYTCIAVFDRDIRIHVRNQIPRVLLERYISGETGYVVRSNMLNWRDLSHRLANIAREERESKVSAMDLTPPSGWNVQSCL